MNPRESVWDAATPVNTGSCTAHGPHPGLICGPCQAARWEAAPPPRTPAPRAYARVLGAEQGDAGPGGAR